MKPNAEIRAYAKEKNVYLYQVSDYLDYSYSHFLTILRKKLTPEEKRSIINAIEEISFYNYMHDRKS